MSAGAPPAILTRRSPYDCPACGLPVWLTPPPAKPMPSGGVVLDLSTLVRALNLHLRTGCKDNP